MPLIKSILVSGEKLAIALEKDYPNLYKAAHGAPGMFVFTGTAAVLKSASDHLLKHGHSHKVEHHKD